MTGLRFRYHTHEFGTHDIHLRTLRDNQQFPDGDIDVEALEISAASWPHFGTVWASGEVLAHLLLDYGVEGKRILEIGCGIGLPSMLLNHRHADITATDYHPDAEAFMRFNTDLNEENAIPFFLSDWKNENALLGTFDLLIGSDILYEPDHGDLLSAFIERHANYNCEIIVVDPGRRQYSGFSKKMVELGFECQQSKPVNTDYLAQPFKGSILRYYRG